MVGIVDCSDSFEASSRALMKKRILAGGVEMFGKSICVLVSVVFAIGLTLQIESVLVGQQATQPADSAPMVESFLASGKLQDGRTTLETYLARRPDDDQARFGLGVVQFMQAVEHLGQSVYRFGVNPETARSAPFLRIKAPENPDPEKIDYGTARKVLSQIEGCLNEADDTLSKINGSDVKLPLHLFRFHLDFDQDGEVGENENIAKIVSQYVGRPPVNTDPTEIVIVFDQADVHWLRGYCCLLRASISIILAHDEEALWDVVAYRLFYQTDLQFEFLREEIESARKEGDEKKRRSSSFWGIEPNAFLDFLGAVHNLNFPLTDGDRMKRAHGMLKRTIGHSREMWAAAKSESDDDREWIPNPNQHCPIVRADITPKMLESWDLMLDESEAVLDGRKLIPFWRGTDKTRGVNLFKVFHEPRDMDLILWVHGSAAVPFLERGELTLPETWRRIRRPFGRNFFFFAGWFN